MDTSYFEIQAKTPFSESLIWELNRNFYKENGIAAWSKDIVPHHMTSNSKVGKTYAELIFAFLKDLALQGTIDEIVYIIELGAGHGRLAFHVLRHLQNLIEKAEENLPPYCYILSDIVEENLSFFQEHPQFKDYLQQGVLDLTYFDAYKSEKLELRYAQKSIQKEDLTQPIIAIANYFFDSLANDLFFVQNQEIASCSVSIHTEENPEEMATEQLIKNIQLSYYKSVLESPFYKEPIINQVLEEYRNLISNSYLFFPKIGMLCLQNLQAFSKKGLMLLTMDKGFHEIHNLQGKKEPDLIAHGSFSLWVNYHALGSYCKKLGGKALFPSFSNFHLEIGCLLFLPTSKSYTNTHAAYQQFVNNFGPDDFNSIKQLAYFNVSRLKLKELIALFRLSAYDSTFFIKLLPRLKQVYKTISVNDRTRLAQTLDCVWEMYFNINEKLDLAYEIGGVLYDLGYYPEALKYFQFSIDVYGKKADIYYNQALCYYQLHQDKKFYETLSEAKLAFPKFELFKNLEKLDMN